MNTHDDLLKRAKSLKSHRTGGWYLENYDDITLADLLLVLEDDNWHTAETILECLATQNWYGLVEACKILVEQEEKGDISTENLYEIRGIDAKNRKVWKG